MIADLVVIGGSAGSLKVVLEVLPKLNEHLQVTIVIVFHRKAAPNSEMLTDLLDAKSPLAVKEAEDKEKILPGQIYIAPAGYHLFLERDYSFSLDSSEKINFSRPSIDLTFITAADVFNSRMIGILLSGANSDGVKGLQTIRDKGGFSIAQEPVTAEVSYMPAKAISQNAVDLIASPSEIATIINGCTPSHNL